MGNPNCTPIENTSADMQAYPTPVAEDVVVPVGSPKHFLSRAAASEPLKLLTGSWRGDELHEMSPSRSAPRLRANMATSLNGDGPAACKSHSRQKAIALAGLWDLCLRCEATTVFNGEASLDSHGGRRSSATSSISTPLSQEGLEELVWDLFRLHDLDGNGLLSEGELIRINEAIYEIHNGSPDSDKNSELRTKYQQLFRDQLDANGKSVPFERFREYILRLVQQYDKHAEAQAMIVEQWVAEAHTARLIGVSGATTTPTIRSDPGSAIIGSSKSMPTPSAVKRPNSNWLLGCCLVQRPATPATEVSITSFLE